MFAIYTKDRTPGKWVFLRRVTLPLTFAEAIEREAATRHPKGSEPMPWVLSGSELRKAVMARLGFEERWQDCKLIIDATEGRKDALLLEIMNVVGYSFDDWTPLMLQMAKRAEVPERPDGRKTAVKNVRFNENENSNDCLHEFLYLQCGHVRGKGRARNWGMVGLTNAALLEPDAFEYFVSKAGFVRSARAHAAKQGGR